VSERDDRLVRCFASVFHGLTPDEIRSTSDESVGTWDSLTTVTLAALVQEEFNVEIDAEVLSRLDSFEAFRGYLADLHQDKE